MKRLLEKDFACVAVFQEKKILIVKWHRKPDEHNFWEVCQMVIKAFKIYFIDTLINDFNNANEFEYEDIQWLGKQIIPITIKCGLRRFMIVDDTGVVKPVIEECVEHYPAKLKDQVSLHLYGNLEDAFDANNLEDELLYSFRSR